MRTRTKDPDGFIYGARLDRCAIVAEAVRNGGLSTPTPHCPLFFHTAPITKRSASTAVTAGR
jgi:hypothetical protein